MSIQVGIYDFFARAIPGGFYIIATLYLSWTLGLVRFDVDSTNLTFIQLIIFVFSAYIIGFVMDTLANKLWARFFKSDNSPEVALNSFKEKHDDLDILFKSKDWAILLANIRVKNLQLAGEIDKYNATQIMMRNISFGFLFLVLAEVILLIQGKSIFHVISGVLFLIFSIIAMRLSIKFSRWFYILIFETTSSYCLDVENLVKRKQNQAFNQDAEHEMNTNEASA